MNPFLIPLYALFSLDFYRIVFSFKVWKGIQYFLALSIVTTLLFLISFTRVGMPRLDNLVEWIKMEMPLITVTSQGLMISEESPYAMNHPNLGALITFDTNTNVASIDQINQSLIFVAKDTVYLRSRNGQVRTINILQSIDQNRQQLMEQPFLITPESVQDFYDRITPMITLILGLIAYPIFLLMKFAMAIFYSWLGLLINMTRKDKLNFSTLFNISIFAMTASIIFQWLSVLIPFLGTVPGLGMVSVLVTVGYLFFAIKKTEDVPS